MFDMRTIVDIFKFSSAKAFENFRMQTRSSRRVHQTNSKIIFAFSNIYLEIYI